MMLPAGDSVSVFTEKTGSVTHKPTELSPLPAPSSSVLITKEDSRPGLPLGLRPLTPPAFPRTSFSTYLLSLPPPAPPLL